MAYDERLAQFMRDDLADEPGITEKKMFGGIAFLRHGNMVCGAYRDRGMFRVGRDHRESALAIDGVGDMTMGTRTMRGVMEADAEAISDDVRRARLMQLALGFVRGLPPK